MAKFTNEIVSALIKMFEDGDRPRGMDYAAVFQRVQQGIQEHEHITHGEGVSGTGDAACPAAGDPPGFVYISEEEQEGPPPETIQRLRAAPGLQYYAEADRVRFVAQSETGRTTFNRDMPIGGIQPAGAIDWVILGDPGQYRGRVTIKAYDAEPQNAIIIEALGGYPGLGFFGKSATAQPAAIEHATADPEDLRDKLNAVIDALTTLGLLASS